MVCHETYKDQNNNWLSPEQVTSINGKKYLKNNTSIEIKVGSSESMSKSKKNTIDPENIIKSYGADSVRLFILSDSPPEKDVQWSEEGIISSYKFIQKLWALHQKIIDEINKNHNEDSSDNLIKFTNKFIKKITQNLDNFNYNIIIANIHEMHTYMNKEINNKYTKKSLIENYSKILTLLEPIIPHLTNEAFKEIGGDKISWPNYDENLIIEDIITFVIQINGKKRGTLEVNMNVLEEEILKKINQDKKLKKYLNEKEIKKKIFIPNKLMNIII
jgi:leucyl-tRNA synthetase